MPGMSGRDETALPPAAVSAAFYHDVVVLALAGGLFLLLWAVATGPHLRPDPDGASSSHRAVDRVRVLWRVGLGILWALDGVLQLQPMFIGHFIGGVLLPLTQGQPGAVLALLRVGETLWSFNPVGWNAGAAVLQMLIAAALLTGGEGSLGRLGLGLSVIWGLVVWVFGEGLGGVFAGGSLVGGAPGSALLYAVASLWMLQPTASWSRERTFRWLSGLMGAVFVLGLWLQLWPPAGYWGAGPLGTYLAGMAAMPQPLWLSRLIAGWAQSATVRPMAWNVAVSAVLAILSAGWILRPAARWLWWGSLAVVVLLWVFGEDFGVLGGMGTDPNTGPVLLLALISWKIVVPDRRAGDVRGGERLGAGMRRWAGQLGGTVGR